MKVVKVLVGVVVSAGALAGAYVVGKKKMNPGPPVEVETDFGALTAAEKEQIAAKAKPYLAAHPPEAPELPDLDAVVRKVKVKLPAGVRWTAMSGDGKRIALAMRPDNSIRILDENGVEVKKLLGETSAERISLSGDGKKLVAFSRTGTSVVWDVEKGEIAAVLSQHNSMGGEAAMTPDGKHAVTSTFEAVTVWNAETGEKEAGLEGGGFQALAVDDHTAVVGTGDGRVVVVDLATGAVADEVRRANLAGNSNPYVFQVAFVGDEDHVVFGDQGGVWLWDRKEKKVRHVESDTTSRLMGGPEGHWIEATSYGELHLGLVDGYVKAVKGGGGTWELMGGEKLAATIRPVDENDPSKGAELTFYDVTQLREPRKWKKLEEGWSEEWK